MMAQKVKKLGPTATFLTLIKGFVCTGCLYLPKSFINGGWTFQIAMMLVSCAVTLYCAELLLQTRKKLGVTSYTEIGYATYGTAGKVSVDIALVLS